MARIGLAQGWCYIEQFVWWMAVVSGSQFSIGESEDEHSQSTG